MKAYNMSESKMSFKTPDLSKKPNKQQQKHKLEICIPLCAWEKLFF